MKVFSEFRVRKKTTESSTLLSWRRTVCERVKSLFRERKQSKGNSERVRTESFNNLCISSLIFIIKD